MKKYWNERYRSGIGAGSGSRGKLYEFKLETVQELVDNLKIKSLVDMGCGDGSQLMNLNVKKYRGMDVSDVAIKVASGTLGTESRVYQVVDEKAVSRASIADMVVSLDVIQHMEPEDAINHLKLLFHLSKRYVLIYAPNMTGEGLHLAPHMHMMEFLPVIWNEFKLRPVRRVRNRYPVIGNNPTGITSFSDFYLYDMKEEDSEGD